MNLREQFEAGLTKLEIELFKQREQLYWQAYSEWLEQRNKDQVEVLKDAYYEIKGLVDSWGIRKEHHPQITILRDLKEQLKKSGVSMEEG